MMRTWWVFPGCLCGQPPAHSPPRPLPARLSLSMRAPKRPPFARRLLGIGWHPRRYSQAMHGGLPAALHMRGTQKARMLLQKERGDEAQRSSARAARLVAASHAFPHTRSFLFAARPARAPYERVCIHLKPSHSFGPSTLASLASYKDKPTLANRK